MKAIILISSIFYILGLKISNKFELIKRSHPVEKTISTTIQEKQSVNAVKFDEEIKKVVTTDSLKVTDKEGDIIDESKHF